MQEFIRGLVSFGGRLGRGGFVGHALVAGGLFLLAAAIGEGGDDAYIMLLMLPALVVYAAAATKRLRDAGVAGLWLPLLSVLSLFFSTFSWLLLLIPNSAAARASSGWKHERQTGPKQGGWADWRQAEPGVAKQPSIRERKRAVIDVVDLARMVCAANAKGQAKSPAELRLVYDWLVASGINDRLRRDALSDFAKLAHAHSNIMGNFLSLRTNPAASVAFLAEAFAMLTALVAANGSTSPEQRELLATIADGFGLKVELPPAVVVIVSLAAKIAKADGVVSRREIAVVDAFFVDGLELSAEMRRKAVAVFRDARDDSASFQSYAKRCAETLATPEARALAFQLFVRIASADGAVTAREAEILDHVAGVFGIAYESGRRQEETPSGEQKGEAFYADILGVAQNADAATIRNAWREKIRQNHPDRVASMSETIRRVADEETKKLNEAYEFFKARDRA
ncbi:TerB family tellurite resistance protein [Martelella radicis]|uniref:Uncharacterized tellurite resistance protein B-like protein/uncharacterized membrane protein YhaH (DUF805 family) n=1 Tax=Martelella radicis TaxID=1397476 RepID=A0A7W6PAT7_9HYPH|nr:TerB family tellurite resistance protein [Martelella radicis]MBB4121959.1 uncharacterized tellurite resistance protein B-like protein/uncharacterized membrane protein YhaH (DUF805 family) [Martelella radicis]